MKTTLFTKKTHSKECKYILSVKNSGKNASNYGKHFSEEHKHKISIAHIGKKVSYVTRRRSSASRQRISYDEWESFAKAQPYCPKFNEYCKESNREKYGHVCFICGLPEKENMTRKSMHWKLSVHHIDMNKEQGCDGHKWKLIPVCTHCHGSLHNKKMESYIQYILENETI